MQPPKPGSGKKPAKNPGAPKNVTDFAADYGWTLAIFKQDPNLWQWLNSKFAEYSKNPAGFSDQRMQLELEQQPFWQDYSKAYIEDLQFQLDYPKQWEASVARDIETTRDQFVSLGAQVDDATLRQMVIDKRRGAYNDAQWQNALADYLSVKDGRFAGAAGATQDSLQQWAASNGVSVSEQMLRDYIKRVTAGDMTMDDVKSDIRKTYLAGAYPAWSDKIQQGFDPADLFKPYLDSARNLLENDSITLDDPIMQKITQAVGPDGKPATVPLYQAMEMVRKDERWQYTDNARNAYANAGEDILRMFGFR